MTRLLQTPLGRFRILAFLEGLSFLAILLVTMPLKYIYEIPEPNKVIGIIHGLLFMLYILGVIILRISLDWNWKTTWLALMASVVPGGTFYFDYRYLRPSQN